MTTALTKNEHVRARVNSDIKREAERVLDSIGMSMSDAIRLLATQIATRREFPLELKVPNEVTLNALKESESVVELELVNDVDALFK